MAPVKVQMVQSNRPTQRNSVTILISTAVSSAIQMADGGPNGIAVQTPVAWTAADIGIDVSLDGTNWLPVFAADGSRVKLQAVPVAAAGLMVFDANDVRVVGTFRYMRLTSLDTSDETAENQVAARTLFVIYV
jgi:hypothetical protein